MSALDTRRDSIVYLLYGTARQYHLELTHSVLSILKNSNSTPPQIVLLTDELTDRNDLPIEHLHFSSAEFAMWTNNGAYKHSAKIHGLAYVLKNISGKVALIDTDTYFTRDPKYLFDRITPEVSVMHADEGTLEEQGATWEKVLSLTDCIDGVDINLGARMFNSGVIGVNREMLAAVERAAVVARGIYTIDREAFNAEQFAVYQCLSSAGQVIVSDDIIQHYWGFERYFVAARLEKRFPEFSAQRFNLALSDGFFAGGMPHKPLTFRAIAKIVTLRRKQGGLYTLAYLAYLCAFASKDPDEANSWAAVAAEAVRGCNVASELARHDFKRLTLNRINEISWLTLETQKRWISYWTAIPNRNNPKIK